MPASHILLTGPVMALFLLGTAGGSPAPEAVEAGVGVAFRLPVLETHHHYDLSGEAVQADFRDDGRFSLPVPGRGSLKVQAVEDEDEAVREGGVFMVPEGGSRTDARRLNVTSIAVEGEVAGHPGSQATLLLGEQGVHGTLTIGRHRYSYDPVQDDGRWMQGVVWSAR